MATDYSFYVSQGNAATLGEEEDKLQSFMTGFFLMLYAKNLKLANASLSYSKNNICTVF